MVDPELISRVTATFVYRRPRRKKSRSLFLLLVMALIVVLSVLFFQMASVVSSPSAPVPPSVPTRTAAGDPLIVYGYVYDSLGQPVDGATVDVFMKYPDKTTVRKSYNTISAGGGYYSVTFLDYTEWYPGDFVDVLATYGTETASNLSVPADEFGLQEIDVSFTSFIIPEIGVPLAIPVSLVIAVVMMGLRRQRTS